MRLSIVTTMCGAAEITCRWFDETYASCVTDPEVVLVENGSTDEESALVAAHIAEHFPRAHVMRHVASREPLGSTAAFNVGLALATGDVVALLHNDLMAREQGWDGCLIDFLAEVPDAGVVGFHGAQGLGAMDIYRTPYRLEQLARWNCWSNLEDWQEHGKHAPAPLPVAVVDGLAICCRRADFLGWGGLDEGLGPHHMYDNDICLTAMAAGKVNYVLPIRARHLSGQTANYPRYNDAFAHLGGDAGIHRTAHERFYRKWQGRLPVFVGQTPEEVAWWQAKRP